MFVLCSRNRKDELILGDGSGGLGDASEPEAVPHDHGEREGGHQAGGHDLARVEEPGAHDPGHDPGHAEGEVVVGRVLRGLIGADASKAADDDAGGAGHDGALLEVADEAARGHSGGVGVGDEVGSHFDAKI